MDGNHGITFRWHCVPVRLGLHILVLIAAERMPWKFILPFYSKFSFIPRSFNLANGRKPFTITATSPIHRPPHILPSPAHNLHPQYLLTRYVLVPPPRLPLMLTLIFITDVHITKVKQNLCTSSSPTAPMRARRSYFPFQSRSKQQTSAVYDGRMSFSSDTSTLVRLCIFMSPSVGLPHSESHFINL